MTAYGQADLTGTDVTWFHVDRTVCDDDGCMCELPTSEQVKARKRASRRNQWYAEIQLPTRAEGDLVIRGAMPEAEARELISQSPGRAKLLRVVEDYT